MHHVYTRVSILVHRASRAGRTRSWKHCSPQHCVYTTQYPWLQPSSVVSHITKSPASGHTLQASGCGCTSATSAVSERGMQEPAAHTLACKPADAREHRRGRVGRRVVVDPARAGAFVLVVLAIALLAKDGILFEEQRRSVRASGLLHARRHVERRRCGGRLISSRCGRAHSLTAVRLGRANRSAHHDGLGGAMARGTPGAKHSARRLAHRVRGRARGQRREVRLEAEEGESADQAQHELSGEHGKRALGLLARPEHGTHGCTEARRKSRVRLARPHQWLQRELGQLLE
mmetsp:Transcript_19194/g.49574  ORF Transcript_19194/g.49574 Transcript_19194/m.49574 type:complete len:289 (+) Transcript_19194:146-1012(+)